MKCEHCSWKCLKATTEISVKNIQKKENMHFYTFKLDN